MRVADEHKGPAIGGENLHDESLGGLCILDLSGYIGGVTRSNFDGEQVTLRSPSECFGPANAC